LVDFSPSYSKSKNQDVLHRAFVLMCTATLSDDKNKQMELDIVRVVNCCVWESAGLSGSDKKYLKHV